jgi:nitroimidazol reductase NimA-like FMN-containing flavoprotein (pyridoxamine 5'-phosphate oxidase superfamily)
VRRPEMHAELSQGERELIHWSRVSRIATTDDQGGPHVVPISHVLDGDLILFATDEESAKVRNLRTNPRVAISFDEYSEDWSNLRGVMVLGAARVLDHGPEWDRVRGLLYGKYLQYESSSPIRLGRTVIVEVEIEGISDSGL